MPINCSQVLTPLSQDQFRELAYAVVGQVFHIHKELGQLFSESIYKQTLSLIRSDVTLELPIDLTFKSFKKRLFLDVLVGTGGAFEFKATEALHPRHRAQLLQYLMLTELRHGMLINVRPGTVQKEFVNSVLTSTDRRNFEVTSQVTQLSMNEVVYFQELLVALLRDWGVGLDLSLYEEAVVHCLGGESLVLQPVPIFWNGDELGHQMVRLVAPGVAFKLTAFDKQEGLLRFAEQARRWLSHTKLRGILWGNIGRRRLTLETLVNRNP